MELTVQNSSFLLILITVMAVLYSSVGHGGASGYLVAMAFFNLSPDIMRPAALIMNIFVASLVLWHLSRERIFNWRLFLPIAIGSIPFAILGGGITLDESHYKWLIGCLLVLAAVLMIFRIPAHERTVPVKPWLALLFGALLGFVSGLTGVGGGIYLSPLLLVLSWTTMRESAAIAAGFILVNSSAGLLGYLSISAQMPKGIPVLVVFALMGAFLGARMAVRSASVTMLRRLLGIVLIIAGTKTVLG